MPGSMARSNGSLIADCEEVNADAVAFSNPAEGTSDGDDEVRS
jgi:hypothetical protein